jgi:TolA-binding protein
MARRLSALRLPPPSSRRSLRRDLRAGATLIAMLATGVLGSAQAAKSDTVLWRNARGQVNTIVGKVRDNSLTQVVVDSGGSERKIDALAVQRIDFGDVPAAFADAQLYLERGEAANAAAKFALAAGDAAARPVVRARARLAAAEAWLRAGGADEAALGNARKECEQFLSEFASNRDAPGARLLLARAQLLLGDGTAAADTAAKLYREVVGTAATPGYPPLVSFQAGLIAGEAYLAVKDAAKAREIYLGLDGAIGSALANLPDSDPLRVAYGAIQSEARLGEGFCLLATGSLSQARTFFQGQIGGADGNPVRRFGAQLGLGETLLAEGDARAAQLELAQVSAIDHTNPDRAARALVGLAECALKLGSKADAKTWLEDVRARHATSPAARKAMELLKSL